MDVTSKLVLVLIILCHCPGHQGPLPLKPAHPPISDLLVALSARVWKEGVLASRIELSTLKQKSIIKTLL
jgi:hypothetical protein